MTTIGHVGELAAEPLDVVDHRLARRHVKDFVQPVQQQHDPPGLFEQPAEQAAGPFVPDRGFFQEADEILAPVALPAAVGAQLDHQRNRLRVPDRRLGNARPAQGQIADQRRLAGAGIAQDDQLPPSPRRRCAKGLVHDVQHGAERLVEVLLPQPIRLLLGFLEFLGGDLAGVQQPPLVFLGDFQQPRVVLVAFPHRLRDEDAPQPDAAVERAGRVEHLEVELVEPLEHRGPVAFRIELGGQGERGRAAGGGNVSRPFRGPRPRRIGQPEVEVALEDLGKPGRTRDTPRRRPGCSGPASACGRRGPSSIGPAPRPPRRIGRQLQLVHLAEEPFDLREARWPCGSPSPS